VGVQERELVALLVEAYEVSSGVHQAHHELRLPDTSGVRGIMRCWQRRRRPCEGARIGNRTLIASGTENGVRSPEALREHRLVRGIVSN
jgi:hypothetical protein